MQKLPLFFAALWVVTLAAATQVQTVDSLVGQTPDAVLAKYGMPDDYTYGSDFLELVYKGKDGKTGKFAFSDGVAFLVPDAGFRPARIRALPKGEVYPGQPIRDAVKVLGNAENVVKPTLGVEVHYANGVRVHMQDGRVYPTR